MLSDDDSSSPPALREAETAAPTAGIRPLASPTIDASQTVSGAETTLLEVATGRVYSWPVGSEVQNPRFSDDGRWLIYNAGWIPSSGQTPNVASIYRIDLQAAQLTPEKLGPGFNPVISARGDIAYVHDVDGQAANVYVRTADGSVHQLAIRGSTFLAPKWAPDGSYLVYPGGSNQPTAGVPGGTPVVIADADTWTARIIDNGGAGTHGLIIDVSPDGQYILHGQTRIVSVATGNVQKVRVAPTWIDATHYLFREYDAPPPLDSVYFSVDVETGGRRKLFDGSAGHVWNIALGMTVRTVQKSIPPDNPSTPGPIDEQYVEVKRFDGSVVIGKLPGEFGTWSPDNRYLTTRGFGSKCQPTIYDLAGVEVACLNSGGMSWGPPGLVAFLRVTRPAQAGPMVATGDVYLLNLVTGAERLLLTGMRWGPAVPCMRWSPDGRWLVADDYCDTF